MDDQRTCDETIEPERYELHAEPVYRFDVTRRRFFKMFGGGIAIFLLLGEGAGQSRRGRRDSGTTNTDDIGSWLHIGEDGKVTVYTGKVEMGQNIRTSLSQIVAEEMRVPMGTVRLVMGNVKTVTCWRRRTGKSDDRA